MEVSVIFAFCPSLRNSSPLGNRNGLPLVIGSPSVQFGPQAGKTSSFLRDMPIAAACGEFLSLALARLNGWHHSARMETKLPSLAPGTAWLTVASFMIPTSGAWNYLVGMPKSVCRYRSSRQHGWISTPCFHRMGSELLFVQIAPAALKSGYAIATAQM